MTKTCLVTGCSGFVGRALSQRMRRAGYALFGIDVNRPIDDGDWAGFFQGQLENADFPRLMSGVRPDVIVHLAGSASVGASVADPFLDFDSLLPGTARLLAWNGKQGPKARVVLVSSAAVYGNPRNIPIPESVICSPISPYGIHKHLAEVMVENYARLYDFDAITFRVFSAYGPGLRKQLLWDLSLKLAAAVRAGQKFVELSGSGEETRDFVYIDDIAEAIFKLGTEQVLQSYITLNLGSGNEVSIKEIGETIATEFGCKTSVKFDNVARLGDPIAWCADIQRITSFGWQPVTPLGEGIRKYVAWFKKECDG